MSVLCIIAPLLGQYSISAGIYCLNLAIAQVSYYWRIYIIVFHVSFITITFWVKCQPYSGKRLAKNTHTKWKCSTTTQHNNTAQQLSTTTQHNITEQQYHRPASVPWSCNKCKMVITIGKSFWSHEMWWHSQEKFCSSLLMYTCWRASVAKYFYWHERR